uniref:SPX domain-containing protein n=1 Tax=Hyaloperonospora arabidopsidis (strain Emoy2) TaxID=559515 RepID=M4B756_HYAAE
MKFGKDLLREVLQSNPEWAPFWLNYKTLKKRIKAVTNTAPHAASQRDISESDLEVAFFRDLQTELKKISLFYAAEERRCSFRFRQLRSVLKTLKTKGKVDTREAQRLMFAFVHFYRECTRLENFAVINYQGFSKILKKHDKMTGYNTRSKYMRRKVNVSSFSSYASLLQILSSIEEMYYEVERDTIRAKH